MQVCVSIARIHACLHGAYPLHVSLLHRPLVLPAWLQLRLAAWRRVHLLSSLHAMVGGRASVILGRCRLLLLLSMLHLLGLATCMLLLLVAQALAVGHQLCLGRLPNLPRSSSMLSRSSAVQVLAIRRLLCLWRLPGESAR